MPDRQHVITPVEKPDEHPAVLAWRRLGLTGVDPTRIDVLKESQKTLACRLVGCGSAGSNVVAKRRATEATRVERTIYRDVLGSFSGPSLRLLGAIDEHEGGMTWMFLEDGGEVMPDLRAPAHRAMAGSWLGRLHSELLRASFAGTLPDRAAGHALGLSQSSRADLMAAMGNAHLDAAGRHVLSAVARRLDKVEARWPLIEAEVSGLPSTLVHGDFVRKNLRLRQDVDGPSIVPFDWEMGGWGPPLVDLGSVDLDAYSVQGRGFWGGPAADLDRLADIGRLFGLLAAVSWEVPALPSPWLGRPMSRLSLYEERIAAVLDRLGLATTATAVRRPVRNVTTHAGEPEDGSGRTAAGYEPVVALADDDRLADGDSLVRALLSIEPGAFPRVVGLVGREPNPYRSTFPSEIVSCTFDDGVERRLFVKRYIPGIHDGYGYWGGGPYEARIYADVLASLDLGTPAYVGSWSDPVAGDSYLAVEFVDGSRLNKTATSRMVDAVRWVARLHREATPVALGRLGVRTYDESFFRGWSQRAGDVVRLARPGCSWIEPLVRRFEDVLVPRLLDTEPAFIHGEFYPENVIVDGDRICAVDWQSAAIGPGEIDLASLTEGPWPPDVVDACRDEYIRHRWPGAVPSFADDAIEAARLYWSMRWLGSSAEATASAQHAGYIDVLRDAAQHLGLVAVGEDRENASA